ncbi:MAG: carboxypeptidase regulatory-like domain-containing protein [Chitinophagales bacterium]
MKAKGILLAILSISLLNIFAQGSLEGNLKNDKGEALELANVALYQNGELVTGTSSDFEGYYFLDNLKEGTYEVVVLHSGAKSNKYLVKIKDRETFAFNTTFTPVNLIDAVTKTHVVETEFFRRAEPTVKIRKAEDFAETGIKQTNKLIALETSTVVDKEGNVSFRGSRPGQGAYYVDGMRLDGSLDIPTAAIYSMKIHNGGIPAAFGNTTSAVVVIETKSYYNMFE